MKFIQDWGSLIAVVLAVIAGVYQFASLEAKVSDSNIIEIKEKAIKEIQAQQKDSISSYKDGINTLPIGSIIAYWGSVSDIEKIKNYEICDGTKVTTVGSTLLGSKKPNLLGKFLRGADEQLMDVVAKPVLGGQDEISETKTTTTTLDISQIPSHSHNVADPGHNHNVENITNAGNIYDKGGSRQAASYFSAPNRRTSKDSTSITIKNTGGTQGHSHKLGAMDNRPAFLSVYFIIKVK